MKLRCRLGGRSRLPLLTIALLFKCVLLSEALLTSKRGGSYSLLRKPRLVLRHSTNDVGAFLEFFNADTLGITGELDDAVNCTVIGGHLEEDDGNLQRSTSVFIMSSPVSETWRAPKEVSFDGSDILQTRTGFNISYDVEGNLTCRDNLGAGLVSNTLLLRYKNRESMVVGLRGHPSSNASFNYEILRRVHKIYAKVTYSKQVGRLVELKRFPEPEAVLRVSYFSDSGVFDQNKIYTAVKEATKYIAKSNKLKVNYIRSTRYCLPVEEGNFTWPMTSAGSMAVPENPCIDGNDTPQPRRACLGDFFQGVHWDKLPKRPHLCLDHAKRSTRLLNLTKKLIKDDLLESLYEEITGSTLLSAVEVYFAAEALRKSAEKINHASYDISAPNISTVVNVMSAILKCGKSVIKAADDSYGSSEIILESMLQLIVSAASPLPVPVSSKQFSAFASEAGTGIQGFAYIPMTNKTLGRMVTFDHKNSVSKILARQPTVLAYLYNQTEDYSIISTLFEDDSLFSAAEYPGMKLEGPVFGMKLFQKGGEVLEEIRPIPLLARFLHSPPKEFGMQCVSWEPTRIGGWSKNSCTLFYAAKDTTVCLCIILTSLDMFFTIVRDDSEVEANVPLLKLLPMKSNNGALLTIFRAELNGSSFIQDTERALSCSLSWGSSDVASPLPVDSNQRPQLKLIGNNTYGGHQIMVFVSISSNLEGYLQCNDNIGLKFISNRILLSKPNSASLVFSGYELDHKMRNIHDFFQTKYTNFNFSTLSVGDINGGVIIRITQISENNHSDFINSLRNFSNDLAHTYGLPLPDIRSNRFCLQHDDGGFTWPTIKLGHFATPINPCVDKFGAPTPVRKCIGGYATGVYWDKSPQRPDPCEQPSKRAQRLKNLSSSVIEKDIFQELLESIEDEAKITVIETNHFKRALKNLAEEVARPNSEVPKPNITSVANIVNTVIEVEKKVKTKTGEIQAAVSSDTLLVSIDKLLESASTNTTVPVITPHFSAVAVSPGTNIKGFLTDGKDITPVAENKTIGDVMALTPVVGAFLVDAPEKVGITYTNFKDSTLFMRSNRTEDSRVASPVIGLNVFGHEEESSLLNMMVLVVFSHDSGAKPRECHYWDAEKSEWSREGCARVPSCDLPSGVSENMDACLCTHLTHFAMLVTEAVEFLSEDYLLHLLTIIGCSISLISLIGIFFIGIIYPEWRRGASRKVQLNLSASLTLLMAVYLAIAFQGECPYSKELCIAFGALLHYSILASFSWMLVVAFLQLIRLTKSVAFGARKHAGTHLVLRASVLGWGVPVLPVAGTLAAGTDLYVRRPNSALCYPSGRSFYAGILFPIALVVMINTLIFLWLIRSLFCNKVQGIRVHQGDERRQILRRFYAAMFLFCLLGISWLSGISIELSSTSEITVKLLSYVFCVTATLQGTSLFIFFVACERRIGEKLSRAATIFSRKGSKVDTNIHYMAKIDGSTSEKATDSTIVSISEKKKSVTKNST